MAYTISIQETLNDVTVASTNYPITISYNAVQLDGEVGPGVPSGGTAGQVLKKASGTDYDTVWVDHSTLGLNNVVEDTTPELGGDLNVGTKSIYGGTGYLILDDVGDTSLGTAGSLSISSTGGISITEASGPEGGVVIGNSNVPVKIYNETSSPRTGPTITTPGATVLNLTTNSGANSGYISLVPGANQNILISPNGTGKIQLDNHLWPNVDGSVNQVLTTNGSGVLSWVSIIDLGAVGPSGTDGTSFTWQGAWNSSYTYSLNDVVEYNGSSYISLDVSTNQNPETTTGYWDLMASIGEMGPNTTISESEPLTAALGEQWFNPANQVLSVYTSTGWVQVGADDLYF